MVLLDNKSIIKPTCQCKVTQMITVKLQCVFITKESRAYKTVKTKPVFLHTLA